MTIEEIMANVAKQIETVGGLHSQMVNPKLSVAQYLTTINEKILKSGVFDLNLALDGATGTFEGKEIKASSRRLNTEMTSSAFPSDETREICLEQGSYIDDEILNAMICEIIEEFSQMVVSYRVHPWIPVWSPGIVKEEGGEPYMQFYTRMAITDYETENIEVSGEGICGTPTFVGEQHFHCLKPLDNAIDDLKAEYIIISPDMLTIMQSATDSNRWRYRNTIWRLETNWRIP